MIEETSLVVVHGATDALTANISKEITKKRHDKIMDDYSAIATTENLHCALKNVDVERDRRRDDIVFRNQEEEEP